MLKTFDIPKVKHENSVSHSFPHQQTENSPSREAHQDGRTKHGVITLVLTLVHKSYILRQPFIPNHCFNNGTNSDVIKWTSQHTNYHMRA